MEELKIKIQELLGQEIVKLELKGKGECNYAYYVETADGEKYIVKKEREVKQTEDQNNLFIEGNLLKELHKAAPTVSLPEIVFVSENPLMYGYKYIEGDLLRSVWPTFSEQEKIDICTALGKFHSEIGKKFTKEMSKASGIRINESLGWHPEIVKAYDRYTADNSIPSEYRELVKKARGIYDATLDKAFFQFIHNDAHHENIIVKDKKISGVIDFGDSEYGEIAKEFSRYIRDFPEHFQYIVDSYIKESGNTLSYPHLISNAFISGFAEIVEDYQKGGKGREKAQKTIDTYKRLLMIK